MSWLVRFRQLTAVGLVLGQVGLLALPLGVLAADDDGEVPPPPSLADPGSACHDPTTWWVCMRAAEYRAKWRAKFVKLVNVDRKRFGPAYAYRVDSYLRRLDERSYWESSWPARVQVMKAYRHHPLTKRLEEFEGGIVHRPTEDGTEVFTDLTFLAYTVDPHNEKSRSKVSFREELQTNQKFWKTFFDQATSESLGIPVSGFAPLTIRRLISEPAGKKKFAEEHATLLDFLYELGFPLQEGGNKAVPVFQRKNRHLSVWTKEELSALKFAWGYAYPEHSDGFTALKDDPVAKQFLRDSLDMALGGFFFRVDQDKETGEVLVSPDPFAVTLVLLLGAAAKPVKKFGEQAGTWLGNKQTQAEIRAAVRAGKRPDAYYSDEVAKAFQENYEQVLREGLPVPKKPKPESGPFHYRAQKELVRLSKARSVWEGKRAEFIAKRHQELLVDSPRAKENQNLIRALLAHRAGERDAGVLQGVLGKEHGADVSVQELAFLYDTYGEGLPGSVFTELRDAARKIPDMERSARTVDELTELAHSFDTQPSEYLSTIVDAIKKQSTLDPVLKGKTAIEYADGFMPWLKRRFPDLLEFDVRVYFSAFGGNRQYQRFTDLKATSDMDAVLDYDPRMFGNDALAEQFFSRVRLRRGEDRAELKKKLMADRQKLFERFLGDMWESYIRDPSPDGAAPLGQYGRVDESGRGASLIPDFQWHLPSLIRLAKEESDPRRLTTLYHPEDAFVFAANGPPFNYSMSQGVTNRFGMVPEKIAKELPWLAKKIEQANEDIANAVLRIVSGHDNHLPRIGDEDFGGDPTIYQRWLREGTLSEVRDDGRTAMTETGRRKYFDERSLIGFFRGFREQLDGASFDRKSLRLLRDYWQVWFRNRRLGNAYKVDHWRAGHYGHEPQVYFEPRFNDRGEIVGGPLLSKRFWKLNKEKGDAQRKILDDLKQEYTVELDAGNGEYRALTWDQMTDDLFWDSELQRATGVNPWYGLRVDDSSGTHQFNWDYDHVYERLRGGLTDYLVEYYGKHRKLPPMSSGFQQKVIHYLGYSSLDEVLRLVQGRLGS